MNDEGRKIKLGFCCQYYCNKSLSTEDYPESLRVII